MFLVPLIKNSDVFNVKRTDPKAGEKWESALPKLAPQDSGLYVGVREVLGALQKNYGPLVSVKQFGSPPLTISNGIFPITAGGPAALPGEKAQSIRSILQEALTKPELQPSLKRWLEDFPSGFVLKGSVELVFNNNTGEILEAIFKLRDESGNDIKSPKINPLLQYLTNTLRAKLNLKGQGGNAEP
ncbi:MAG TPA: hypothetical protein DF383_06255, partial [Deltaproteobacteria bacterium]|nr:hypothetical protein [Deltaproteobacteria bacterium]